MALKRKYVATRAQGKCATKTSKSEAHQQAHFNMTTFTTIEEYQRFKNHFSHRNVVPKKDIDFI